MKTRSLIGRLFKAGRLSATCIANGLRGARVCACKTGIQLPQFWGLFLSQTIRDLVSIVFHEVVPDPYEPIPTTAECTVIFLPGYSMTSNGASPLLSYLAGAGFQITTCEERMIFNNVRAITKWAYKQVAIIRAAGQTPILLGYSMGGDIAQRVAGKMGIDVISLSTPIMSQNTFFAALDMILRGQVSPRKTFRGCYGTSLSEEFSFHIPRPDQEGHVIIKDIYSHFGVNSPGVIQAVAERLEKVAKHANRAFASPRSVSYYVVYSHFAGPESAHTVPDMHRNIETSRSKKTFRM